MNLNHSIQGVRFLVPKVSIPIRDLMNLNRDVCTQAVNK